MSVYIPGEFDDEVEKLKELDEMLNEELCQCFTKFEKVVDKKNEESGTRYVFSQNPDNNEIHIHKAHKVRGSKVCKVEGDPICGPVSSIEMHTSTIAEEDAYTGEKIRCAAAYGQNGDYEICGTCVSSLYHTVTNLD